MTLLTATGTLAPHDAAAARGRGAHARTQTRAARSDVVPADAAAYTPPPGCVLLAATNDVHGALAPYTVASGDGRGAVSEGGVLALSGYVDTLRQVSKGRFMLLDAGDMFQGTMASNLSLGAAMVATYNALGYDAAAIGNHEFDYGTGGDTSPDADATSVLKARIASANFPFLASNIDQGQPPRPLAWPNVAPSLLKNVGGVWVGIVGASTPTTKEATNPRYVADLTFAAPGPRIEQQAASLRARGAQLVVLLAHMGGRCDDRNDPNNLASCKQSGIERELLDVITSMPPGTVDVAIGAHTHQFMAHWSGNTAIIESGSQGHHMGMVLACPTAPSGGNDLLGLNRARSHIYPTQPLCLTTWRDGTCTARRRGTPTRKASFAGSAVHVVPEVARVARPFLEAVDARERASIGALLPASLSPRALTALIAEALRRATHADFGVQNRGGVRTAIAAGATTYKQVFEAVPFDNYATVLTLTGQELTALVRALRRDRLPELYPSFAGLRVEGQGESIVLVGKQGVPLNDATFYTLCTTDFILNGGDGAGAALAGFAPSRSHTLDLTLRDALVRLLASLHPNPIAAAM